MAATSAEPALCLVVPTLDEAEGIEAFLRELLRATEALPLGGRAVELLVMDDRSRDGTAELARAVLGARGSVVVREGPRGLGRSVLEGWRRSRAPLLGVLDADLSHPPALLPALLARIEAGADLAIATRYAPGGGTAGWPLSRRLASRTAALLARALVRASDPLSGYFLVRRAAIEDVPLDPTGWKICLEVLVRGRYREVAEVPYLFHDRAAGSSKFGARAVRDYLAHLARLRLALLRQGRLRR